MTDDAMIAALLREREGYVQRGLADRVAQVDEQLALRGYAPPVETPAPVKPAGRTAAPKARRAPSRETA